MSYFPGSLFLMISSTRKLGRLDEAKPSTASSSQKPATSSSFPREPGTSSPGSTINITYLMVRVDPNKVVPLMDEAASKAYLAEHRR